MFPVHGDLTVFTNSPALGCFHSVHAPFVHVLVPHIFQTVLSSFPAFSTPDFTPFPLHSLQPISVTSGWFSACYGGFGVLVLGFLSFTLHHSILTSHPHLFGVFPDCVAFPDMVYHTVVFPDHFRTSSFGLFLIRAHFVEFLTLGSFLFHSTS